MDMWEIDSFLYTVVGRFDLFLEGLNLGRVCVQWCVALRIGVLVHLWVGVKNVCVGGCGYLALLSQIF